MPETKRRISMNEFILVWKGSDTLQSVSEKLGKDRSYCITRRYGVNAFLKKNNCKGLEKKPDMASARGTNIIEELLKAGLIERL